MRRPILWWRVASQLAAVRRGHSLPSWPHLQQAADWLLLAQRNCPDGAGYSRRFRLLAGWDLGYVETTGYIIPTLFKLAHALANPVYRESALRAGEWLLARQNPDGSFSEIDAGTKQAFDTGQVLLGLNALQRELPEAPAFREAAQRAAQWLLDQLNPDGTWTAVAFRGRAHTYYSRSGAALLEAGLQLGRDDFVAGARRHLGWVLSRQRTSGWFEDCEFEIGQPALLHTIVYVIEGLLAAHELTGAPEYLEAAERSARGLARAAGGALPVGYYARDWCAVSGEYCVTGLAQWAGVCRRLLRATGDTGYGEEADRALRFLGNIQIRAPGPLRGALPNVVPWHGSYGKFGAFNWNVKFYLDALLEA